ncbi:MAG: hypothetical protein ABIB71_02840 [Candidatus Woesearchaeota archaeon]
MGRDIDFDALDKKIQEFSNKSKKAPVEFLVPELRRFFNISIISYLSWCERDFTKDFNDFFFDYALQKMENDYTCYFEREQFEKDLSRSSWWKATYAGCNAQIEHFLIGEGLAVAVQKLGFEEEYKPVREIEKSELPEKIYRYFIGIGYLYPDKDKLIVHPNMLFSQVEKTLYGGDSTFLSRDLIRCPHLHVSGSTIEEPLSDEELWAFWSDLVALSLADLPEYRFYMPRDFRSSPNKFQSTLELGRKLVPQRYIALEPKIEQFEWVLPEEKKV